MAGAIVQADTDEVKQRKDDWRQNALCAMKDAEDTADSLIPAGPCDMCQTCGDTGYRVWDANGPSAPCPDCEAWKRDGVQATIGIHGPPPNKATPTETGAPCTIEAPLPVGAVVKNPPGHPLKTLAIGNR